MTTRGIRALTWLVIVGACLAAPTVAAAVTLNPGDILVADQDAFGGGGAIIKVDPVTGAQELIASGGFFVQPRALAVDAAGRIIVVDPGAFGGSGGLIRVDPATGAQTVISSGGLFVIPLGVAVDAAGKLIVSNAGPSLDTGSVVRVDADTGSQTLVSSGGAFVDPHGVAVAADGRIIVADHDAADQNVLGAIIAVDPVTGGQTVISSAGNLVRLVHVTTDAAGNIIVIALGFGGPASAVVSVDPVTGQQTVISSAGLFVNPTGVAIEASGQILVADRLALGGAGAVIRVDPVSGSQTVVSSGGFFVNPIGLGIWTGSMSRELTSLTPATIWVGLKNSDDQGTQFDVRVELYVNSGLVSEGLVRCVTGVTRNPSNAKEVTVQFGAITGGAVDPGDVVSLQILTRIGTNPDGTKCPGHNNANGLRVYYDAGSRPSRFGAEIAPDPLTEFFLRSAGSDVLDAAAPSGGTPKFKDSSSVNFAGGNPWKAIGTWSMTWP